MTIECKFKQADTLHLAFHDEINIYTVMENKQALLAYFNQAHEIHIDLSAVTEIDTAGVQLLMFIKQEARDQQIKICFTQHSQSVVETLELLNLSKPFGDPIVITAKGNSV